MAKVECHSERGGPDILTAKPVSVLRPIVAQDTSSARVHRAFPRRCGGYAEHTGRRQRFHGLWDCHTPCPGTEAAALPQSAGGAPPRWPRALPPRAWYRGRWPQRGPRLAGRHPLPPRDGVLPLFPTVCGVAAHQLASHPRFAHGGVGGLPLPVHPAQHATGLHQDGPKLGEDTALTPLLEVAMHGAIVAKLLRQLIPLATRAQTEDNAIEHPAQLHAAMPLGLSRITVVEDWLDHCPYVIRYFPMRWLSCGVHANPPCLYHTGELSSDRAC